MYFQSLYRARINEWLEFIRQISGTRPVYGLVRRNSSLVYRRTPQPEETVLFEARPVEPLKLFFYFPSEKTASLPEKPWGDEEQRILLGVKACDLEALKTADHIYRLGDAVEPRYFSRRSNTLLIGSDCTGPLSTCFCSLHGRMPYPRENFDLNLSPAGERDILIEVGTPKGGIFLDDFKPHLTEAGEHDLLERERIRQLCLTEVNRLNRLFVHGKPYSETVRKSGNAAVWKKFGQELCVQCHACNLGCPTCYCFSFSDISENGGMVRYKNWDSCLTASFARMASGATPRPERWERFRYHYYHKFDFLNRELGFDACTGCGRCIDGCLGKIDKRQVLCELEKEVYGQD